MKMMKRRSRASKRAKIDARAADSRDADTGKMMML